MKLKVSAECFVNEAPSGRGLREAVEESACT